MPLLQHALTSAVGILCGQCKDGMGVSVLSSKCVSCSDGFLTLIPLLGMHKMQEVPLYLLFCSDPYCYYFCWYHSHRQATARMGHTLSFLHASMYVYPDNVGIITILYRMFPMPLSSSLKHLKQLENM